MTVQATPPIHQALRAYQNSEVRRPESDPPNPEAAYQDPAVQPDTDGKGRVVDVRV